MAENSEEKKPSEQEKQKEETKKKKESSFFGKQTKEFSEAFKQGPKAIFSKIVSFPFQFLPSLLKIFVIFIVIITAILFLLFIFNLLTGGGISVLGTELSVLLSRISGPLSSIITPVASFVKDPIGTVAQYGTFKNPQEVENKKPQGVEFRKFETKRAIHRSNVDPIEVISTVKIYALEDSSTQVEFSCFKEDVVKNALISGGSSVIRGASFGLNAASSGTSDYAIDKTRDYLTKLEEGEIKIYGEQEGAKLVDIFPSEDRNLNLLCKFNPVDIAAEMIKDRTISEKIILKANYKDFIVRSRLKVYTLESSILDNLEKDNINPFNYFKINDPLISSDRSVRPEQLKSSPAPLSLTLLDQQPLKPETTYLLGINLYNDKLSWNGKISKLHSLKIFLPEGFKPSEGCNEFNINNNVLDLNLQELSKLNKNILDNLIETGNRVFSKDSVNSKDIIPDDLRLFCEFSIDSSVVNPDLSFSLINAEAKFNYEFEAFTSALISSNLLSNELIES